MIGIEELKLGAMLLVAGAILLFVMALLTSVVFEEDPEPVRSQIPLSELLPHLEQMNPELADRIQGVYPLEIWPGLSVLCELYAIEEPCLYESHDSVVRRILDASSELNRQHYDDDDER